MAKQRAKIDALQREIERLEKQREAVFNDQARLRENLARVPEGSDLSRRYLQKLSAQENELEAIETQRENARNNLEALRQKLEEYIHGLSL
jgi:predicted RNase H-like nuclease (RuvC/YqgF family)